jgi:hypothetical protein
LKPRSTVRQLNACHGSPICRSRLVLALIGSPRCEAQESATGKLHNIAP